MATNYLSTHYTSASCILDDRITGERFIARGSGYDRMGTVFAAWLAATYPERLEALRPRAEITHTEASTRLTGSTGIEAMLAIANEIGLTVTPTYATKGVHRGDRTGFLVEDTLA